MIKISYKVIHILIPVLFFLVIQFNTAVYAQDGELGGSTGGDSGLSQNNTSPSGDWADYTGNDVGGSNDDSFGDYTDYSGGDGYSSFADYINAAIGLGNEAGTIAGPGTTAPLGNQSVTLDQNGVTASYDPNDDPCVAAGSCPYPAPVLYATASCVGSQPVVDLSWSGVPVPTAANSWMGSYSFLIRSPRLETAQSVQGTMRVFPFAPMSYGTFSYRDTYREYWSEGYTTSGWTEVTSTDENGNPTGYTEHPGTYVAPVKVLTQNVAPYSFYYYRIYSTNAGGAVHYTSTIPGMTLNFSYTARTPLSNIIAVYTPGCGAPSPLLPPPSPTTAPVATPVPTPTPMPTPTVSLVSLNNLCTVGGWSQSDLSFSSPSAGIEAFHLDKNGQYYGSAFPANPNMKANIAPGETANFTARVQVGGVIYGGSNTVTIRSANCIPTARPVITLTLTTPKGTFSPGSLPVTVNQNQLVTVNWQIELADWASASSSPGKSEWLGAKNKVSGSQVISTSEFGNYVLGLNAANVVGMSSVSIQLNVIQYPKPYIQTTGGDVHSNETIYMSPN